MGLSTSARRWTQISGSEPVPQPAMFTADGPEREGGSQTAPLPEDVYRAIVDYLRAAGRLEGISPEAYIFAPLVDPLSRVACGQAEDWEGTRHVSSKRMRETLKTFGRVVGIPDEKLTLQALRHTAVLLRLEAGDSTEQIQAFLKRADLKATRRYLSLLPAPSLPTSCPGDEPAALPRPPARKPKPFQPGDNFCHGFYAQSHPPEEIAAMLAQDIRGMAEELEGLRVLERGLVEMQSRATSAAELAALVDAQSLAAARLVEMAKTEKERQAQRPEDSWGERMLAMEVDYARAQGEDIDIDTARQQVLANDAEAQAAWRLMEEVAATRLGLRRIFNIAIETQDVKDRIHLTDIYGRSCTRLVKLLKAEGRKHSRLDAVMSDALHQALTEIYEEFGLS